MVVNEKRHSLRPQRHNIQTEDPDLQIVVTDDGSRTLKHRRHGTTWHSESGALSESRLVFLHNSGIVDRLSDSRPVRVLEIGFGTGLNFWLTASVALNRDAQLEFVGLEPDRLPVAIVRQLEHGRLVECQPAFDLFFDKLFASDDQPTTIALDQEKTRLRLEKCSATAESLSGLAPFDAVFHDPFDPHVAPELWQAELFKAFLEILIPGGRLVTYCVKSEIQRRLQAVGFSVRKTPGPAGGKREVLIAEKAL